MSSLATETASGVFRKVTAREAAVLLAIAWLIPFLVHLAPWGGARPLGAYLLPMFWATFVAVYFYGAGAGLLTGLFAPAVNLALTGLPAAKSFGVAAIEVVIFVFFATWMVRLAPRGWWWAPLGYLVARIGSALLLSAPITFGSLAAAGKFLEHVLVGGVAGLVVLALINAALVNFYPKATNQR
jgi:hypothetical protein